MHSVVKTLLPLVFITLILLTPFVTIRFQPECQRPLQRTKPQGTRERLDHVIPLIEELQKIGGAAGMSIGVMSHGEVVLDHHLGFADVEQQLTADINTRYPLASLTKAFLAATMTQLVNEGLLNWDQPVNTYIPELAFDSDPTLAARLTLTDLLSHNTGLLRLDAFWLGANAQVVVPKNFTVALCNHLTPVHPLRSKWLYNNWMYALAGEMVERVTNSSWGQVLETKVLDKLDLSQTSAIGSNIPVNSTALPYIILNDQTPVRVPDAAFLDGTSMSSTGGIRSNVKDMLAWGNSLLSVSQGNEHPIKGIEKILSGQAFINQSMLSDELYALGFAKAITPTQFGKIGFNAILLDQMPIIGENFTPTRAFYHSGGGTGYNHNFMIVPEHQLVIVVLTNSIGHGDTADWTAQTIFQAALGIKSPVDLKPMARQVAATWRAAYQQMADTLEKERIPDTQKPLYGDLVGTFYHPTRAVYIEVFETDGQLKFNLNGRSDQEHVLSHYHHDTFIFLPTAEERIRRVLFHYGTQAWLLHFKRDGKGNVVNIVWNLDPESPAGESFERDTIDH